MMVLLFKQSIHLKTNKKRNSRFILKRPRREMWQNLGKECDEKFEAHEMSPMTDDRRGTASRIWTEWTECRPHHKFAGKVKPLTSSSCASAKRVGGCRLKQRSNVITYLWGLWHNTKIKKKCSRARVSLSLHIDSFRPQPRKIRTKHTEHTNTLPQAKETYLFISPRTRTHRFLFTCFCFNTGPREKQPEHSPSYICLNFSYRTQKILKAF